MMSMDSSNTWCCNRTCAGDWTRTDCFDSVYQFAADYYRLFREAADEVEKWIEPFAPPVPKPNKVIRPKSLPVNKRDLVLRNNGLL